MHSEAHIIEGFWRAAHGDIGWDDALDLLVVPLGCRSGHIGVLDRRAGIVASILSRATPADLRDVEAHRVSDPSVNPRLPHLMQTAPGLCITDDAIIREGARRNLPIYRDFFLPTGTAGSALIHSGDGIDDPRIAFALMGADGGPATTAPVHRLIERLFPAMAGATRLAVRFGGMQADAMVAALDQHRRPCIALRRDMVPTAISPASEGLLSSGDYLGVRHGRLYACHRDADRRLRLLVERIAALDPAAMRRHPVVLQSALPDRPLIVASLTPVPSRGTLSESCALLTLPGPAAPDELSQLLTDLYRLTPTEAAVALAVAAGQGPTEIAAARGQSRETVRTHLRAILAKTETRRQSELAALVGRLMQ